MPQPATRGQFKCFVLTLNSRHDIRLYTCRWAKHGKLLSNVVTKSNKKKGQREKMCLSVGQKARHTLEHTSKSVFFIVFIRTVLSLLCFMTLPEWMDKNPTQNEYAVWSWLFPPWRSLFLQCFPFLSSSCINSCLSQPPFFSSYSFHVPSLNLILLHPQYTVLLFPALIYLLHSRLPCTRVFYCFFCHSPRSSLTSWKTQKTSTVTDRPHPGDDSVFAPVTRTDTHA